MLSKITDIIPATNARRFCTEFLKLGSTKYSIHQRNARDNHHDTICNCLEEWRNKTEGEGKNAKNEMFALLKFIQKQHGWFTGHEIASVFEEELEALSEERT